MTDEQTEILKQILKELKEIKEEVATTKGYVFNLRAETTGNQRFISQVQAQKDVDAKIKLNARTKQQIDTT